MTNRKGEVDPVLVFLLAFLVCCLAVRGIEAYEKTHKCPVESVVTHQYPLTLNDFPYRLGRDYQDSIK